MKVHKGAREEKKNLYVIVSANHNYYETLYIYIYLEHENAQVHTAASGEKGNHLFLIISILTKAVFRMPTSINT